MTTVHSLDIETIILLLAVVGGLTVCCLIVSMISIFKIRQVGNILQDYLDNAERKQENKLAESARIPDRQKSINQIQNKQLEPKKSVADNLTRAAYDTYGQKYQHLVSELDVDNYQEKSKEMADLIVEMGLWLKDYLPVAMGDINTTDAQRNNVKSVEADGDERSKPITLLTANENPYDTPLEVIGLMRRFKDMGVSNLGLTICGYKYE